MSGARSDLRRVAVLGSTGSIGRQALDVLAADAVRGDGREMVLVGLAAGSSGDALAAQARQHGVEHVLLGDAKAAHALRAGSRALAGTAMGHGDFDALLDACRPDLVLNAVVGFAGLEATVAALGRGIDVALANKESLVAAGNLCLATAASMGARVIPVDSEHSALAQCLAGSRPEEVETLVLTASGGPFHGRTRGELHDVTVEQALDHPTWKMGGKITVDSATLMNKGLELIEAMVLFNLPEDAVETVVHRHSIVHALVRHRDGSLLAHLGWPDMRVPIAWALHHPRRPAVDARRLSLLDMPPLEFAAPDTETFRCLALAREAARAGGGAPCVLNAANEAAVEAFLDGRLPFLGIADVVERALDEIGSPPAPGTLDEARDLDARARAAGSRAIAAVGPNRLSSPS